MSTAELKATLMVKVNSGLYESSDGTFFASIEEGTTPNGSPVGGRWVLRDATGARVDVDQYRNNLFERNGLRTHY